MRALLVFYMIKGFLGYNDEQAYSVYGAYTGLVYATPFIGGMLADRLLGQRFAVVVGGLLMSAGHLAMTFENEIIFFIFREDFEHVNGLSFHIEKIHCKTF